MKLSKIDGAWWIVDCPPGYALPELPGIGPYDSRWDADDDREGLERSSKLPPRSVSVDSNAKRVAVQLELC